MALCVQDGGRIEVLTDDKMVLVYLLEDPAVVESLSNRCC